ncbi:MAG: FkbM family methyltransferase [Verrucomicrobia bacterium]|nr:FkbM family methyltransferase [Verrucomicrobiota bacterium]
MTSPSPTPAPWGTHLVKAGPRRWLLRLLHALPTGSAWRRLALWLRKPLKNSLPPVVDVDIWGLRLRLKTRGNLSEQRLLLMPQYLDTLERDLLSRELRSGGVFFDIGANIGVYSLWVASACGSAVRVEAFEPDPALCQRLAFNLATNALTHVNLNPVALGRAEGTATLVSGAGNSGENRVEAAPAAASLATSSASGTSTGNLVVTTLAGFVSRKNIARIDALKIDVEGYELDILEPFFATAPRPVWPRLLICELIHEREHALGRLLASQGYVLTESSRLNGVYRLT